SSRSTHVSRASQRPPADWIAACIRLLNPLVERCRVPMSGVEPLQAAAVKPQAESLEAWTHREAINALSDDELTRLKETRDSPGLVHLAGHVALLAATATAVLLAPNWPLWLAAVTAHGIVLIFLFTVEHEAIHATAFRSAWLNRTVAE